MRNWWQTIKRDTMQFIALVILITVLALLLILGAPAR